MKKWTNFFSTIWIGLITHKLRSFLTILGVVIGVASVITLMSIGKGSEQQILNNIQSLGSNLITIRPGASIGFGGIRGGFGGTRTLTTEDADAIAQLPDVTAVSPTNSSSLQLIVGNQNTNAQVNGVNAEYFGINNLTVASGVLFSDTEYQSGAEVAVLGSNVATTLFPNNANPIGQQMRMGMNIVQVTGVLQSKGASFGSADDAIFIPLTTMEQTVAVQRTAQGGHVTGSISLTVSDSSQTQNVIDAVTNLLRNRHLLSASAASDFNIQSVEEIAATLTQTIGTLTLLLGAIAAISLLVGGIGVMNIMLVSVLERTREIGIRKALGARQRDIWSQFLFEASLLTFAGGIIGVFVGWAVSYIVSKVGTFHTLVTADVVFLAVGVSIAIGIFFGFYPAWNASRLNPIEALRSE
ncbi:MAG: ABC transporter permease [Dehalococcoidales bacterium]|jgi:putative ABC transport system permease protein